MRETDAVDDGVSACERDAVPLAVIEIVGVSEALGVPDPERVAELLGVLDALGVELWLDDSDSLGDWLCDGELVSLGL